MISIQSAVSQRSDSVEACDRIGSQCFSAQLLLIRQRNYARKFLAFEELERGAASGGDVRDLVGDAGLLHGADAIATTHNGSRPGIISDGMRDRRGALGKLRELKHSHWTIPYDGPRT